MIRHLRHAHECPCHPGKHHRQQHLGRGHRVGWRRSHQTLNAAGNDALTLNGGLGSVTTAGAAINVTLTGPLTSTAPIRI